MAMLNDFDLFPFCTRQDLFGEYVNGVYDSFPLRNNHPKYFFKIKQK